MHSSSSSSTHSQPMHTNTSAASTNPSMQTNTSSSAYNQPMQSSTSSVGPSAGQQYPQLLQQMMNLSQQHYLSQAIHTITKAGVPDVLANQGPLTTLQIQQQIPQIQNQTRLEQIMRYLSSFGVFRELNRNGAAAFELTPLSQLLRTNVPNQPSLGHLFSVNNQLFWNSISMMPHSLYNKTDDSLISLANGGKNHLSIFSKNKVLAQEYQDMTTSTVLDSIPHILNVYQMGFEELSAREGILLDMGGNAGYLPSAINRLYPRIKAMSYDFQHFTDLNKQRPLEGVEFIPGNFLDAELIPKSDVTIIYNPQFDMTDALLLPLMKILYERMNINGKLLHIVQALPEPGAQSPETAFNYSLNMQAMLMGGHLRTLNEWRIVYQSVGFRMAQIFQLQDALRSYMIISEKV